MIAIPDFRNAPAAWLTLLHFSPQPDTVSSGPASKCGGFGRVQPPSRPNNTDVPQFSAAGVVAGLQFE